MTEQIRDTAILEEFVQPFIEKAQEAGVFTEFAELEPETIDSLWEVYDRYIDAITDARTGEEPMVLDGFQSEILEELGVDVDDMELSELISQEVSSDPY